MSLSATRLVRSRRTPARVSRKLAVRRMVLAALDATPLPERAPCSTKFRLVIWTQVYENYGYRWKPKGGSEYHIQLGGAEDIRRLGPKGLQALVDEARPLIERKGSNDCLHSSDETVMGWDVFGDKDKTPDEAMEADFRAWGQPFSPEESERYRSYREDWRMWAERRLTYQAAR